MRKDRSLYSTKTDTIIVLLVTDMNERIYKVMVINPGSTSTKVALFENEKCIFSRSVFHDSSELLKLGTINDQLQYRMNVTRKFLEDSGVDLHELDAVVGRGGPCTACRSGIYEINDKLVEDTRGAKGGLYHSSMLGVQMAMEYHNAFGMPAFMVDPPVVDELSDEARITGVKNIYRRATCHVLNLKATAKRYAEEIGRPYEDLRLIVAHIDGGISVTCHKDGRIIDANDAGGGEGPFTPTRMGTMSVTDVLDYLFDKDPAEVRKLCSQAGGLSSWFGTSDSRAIHERAMKGDAEAARIWNAMLYQCTKWIAMMAAPLEGKVDAVVLTGGLLRIAGVGEYVADKVKWIAPVKIYPGEFEHESMVEHALQVLRGEVVPMEYTGEPVWKGFED